MCNVLFGEDANIQGVTIAVDVLLAGFFGTKISHEVATISLGNKSIECGYNIGIFLRTINAKVSAYFVNLIFDGISWNYLNKAVYNIRRFFANVDTMPRVRFVS